MIQIISSEVCFHYLVAYIVLSINFLLFKFCSVNYAGISCCDKIHIVEIMVWKISSVYLCKSNCLEPERSIKATRKEDQSEIQIAK